MKWSNLWFPCIFVRTHGRYSLKFGMLIYSDHLQNWLDDYILVKVCWFSSFWWYFDLAKQVKFVVCWDFLEHMGVMAWNVTCWCILTTLETDSILVSLSIFLIWRRFDLLKQEKMWFPGIFVRTHGRNELNLNMLMYPEHLQNWLEFGHGLLIFLIFVMTAP